MAKRTTAGAIVLALASLASITGCVTETPDDTFGFDDAGGKADGTNSAVPLIQTNNPFYWAPSDYPSFLALEATISDRALPTAIVDDDALTQRLQGWVDRIDAIVRAEVERGIGAPLVAPTPIVKVLPSGSTYNAWVSGTIACSGTTLAGASPTMPGQSFIQSDYVMHQSGYGCLRPTYPDVTEFRTFWERHKPLCKLGDDLAVGGTGCQVEAYGAPGELAFVSTSPFIHVSTDLIASMSERTLVVVLAHELGHYYRSHSSDAKVQRYDFWYETEVDRKKLPVESTTASELQAVYSEIVAGPQTVQSATAGVYSARLRTFLLGDLAALLRERQEPGFVCAAARDALGAWVEPLVTGYGMPTDAMTSYLAFEQALAACAPQLQMTGDPGATSLSYGTVLMAVMNAKLPGATYPFRATLADVLTALNGRAVRLDQKAAALQKRVHDNRIGLYTTEQEADNIALALSTKLGISADEVVASWLEFMDAITGAVAPEYRATYEAEAASCRTLLAADFTTTDAAGNRVPAFISLGDLGDKHHSDCYRLFNFWREQKARKYTVATPLVFDGPSWDALRTHARELSDAARANGQ
jgi:hypothetical protein